MTSRRASRNFPTDAQMLAAAVTALDNLIDSVSEIKDGQERNTESIESLVILQREQNSNVAKVKEAVAEHKTWINKHNDWHGKDDENTRKRGYQLDLLKLQWKLVGATLGAGLAIGKLINVIGWW